MRVGKDPGFQLYKPSTFSPYMPNSIMFTGQTNPSFSNCSIRVKLFNIPSRERNNIYLTMTVRRSNQLSYEATDIGSWSFVGSNVPVRNESTMK